MKVAVQLIEGQAAEDNELASSKNTFSSTFFRLLRLKLAGSRHDENAYGAELDGVAAFLDGMTERDVVPNLCL